LRLNIESSKKGLIICANDWNQYKPKFDRLQIPPLMIWGL